MKNLIHKNLEDSDVVEFINDYHLEQSKSTYAVGFKNANNTITFLLNKETNTIDVVSVDRI